MIIAKYNRSTGYGSKPSAGTTAVAGSTAIIDLTPITEKVASLELKVSQLERQLSQALATLAGLDAKYLSRNGDRSEYSYHLGALYSDFIQSDMYDNGVGFRVSGNATAAVEDKFNFIIRDTGSGTVTWNTVQQEDMTMVTNNTTEDSSSLSVQEVSIGAANADGYLLLDCGAALTRERCFTVISKKVEYQVKRELSNSSVVSRIMEAEQDSNGNFILLFQKANNIKITVWFTFTFAFRKYGDVTSGAYRLYIRGTDYEHNQTDCFSAATKTTTINASGVTVMNNNNGTRVTYDGVKTTHDGGTTWT